MAWRLVPRESLGDLAGKPLRRRMVGDANRYQSASVVPQNDKAEQQLECNRRHDEEIDRSDSVGLVMEERPPGWRPRTAMLRHVFRDGRLRDVDPKLQQLAVDSRRAPQRIGLTDLTDEILRFLGHLWPAGSGARSPTPVGTEALTVPAHDRLWPQDAHRPQNARPYAIRPNEKYSIGIGQRQALRRRPSKHV